MIRTQPPALPTRPLPRSSSSTADSPYRNEQDDTAETTEKFDLADDRISLRSHTTVDKATGRVQVELNIGAELEVQDDPDTPLGSDESIANPSSVHLGRIPHMNIVILIVGSQGDVQPYVALALRLVGDGHRVRIGTHKNFEEFIEKVTHGTVEFYDIGGDPKALMSYMVKNPGIMPGWESLTNGDIKEKTSMLTEIMQGTLEACQQPDPASGRPFAADVIVANPPSFGHIHVAEALGIPLHMSFTMPWSATTAFAHPLVDLKTNASNSVGNYMSYGVAEHLQWQGLQRVINKFRAKSLGLEPLSPRAGPGIIDRLKIPYTYCWSSGLIPKPKDWKGHIDISGFYFLDQATTYTPPDDLAAFLARGAPPIYIGFGSVPVKDPARMTATLFEAARLSGVRALISAGWGGLGGTDVPDNVFILGNVPHDWLFTKVSAVCHHGGAGTNAIGLANGRPTIVVPFFGDQVFWGNMVHQAGAGPRPIPADTLNSENLSAAIQEALTPESLAAAGRLGAQIRAEDGVEGGMQSLYRQLPLERLRCDLCPDRLAVWDYGKRNLRLSALAAAVLVEAKRLSPADLSLSRPVEYITARDAVDPLSGAATAGITAAADILDGTARLFYKPKAGAAKIALTPIDGGINVLDSFTSGLHNLPRLYGYQGRKRGKVTGVASGLQEGGKQFGLGLYDGLTGLVTTPMREAKKDGAIGALRGIGQGVLNAILLPYAGIFGMASAPLVGLMKTIKGPKTPATDKLRMAARLHDGRQALERSPEGTSSSIVAAFDAKMAQPEDKEKLMAQLKKVLNREGQWSPDSKKSAA